MVLGTKVHSKKKEDAMEKRAAQIHFRNKPFMAFVAGEGDTPIQCTPIVYDDEGHCGLGILYGDGRAEIWGMLIPRNLITAWRGTEILRRLDTIEYGTLCHAYATGGRNPNEQCVEPTIKKIGRVAYEDIMSMPVPEEIIRAILDNQKNQRHEYFAPSLCPISDEVRAGTIKWRQEFAAAGVKHPDFIDRANRVYEKERAILSKFRKLLDSYAKSGILDLREGEEDYVEKTLLDLSRKGADRVHPDHTLIALAVMMSNLATRKELATTNQFLTWVSGEWWIIRQSAEWLARLSRKPQLRFWKILQGPFTEKRAQVLLVKMLGEYFPTELPPANDRQ